jgi:hypothetical protein
MIGIFIWTVQDLGALCVLAVLVLGFGIFCIVAGLKGLWRKIWRR